MSQWHRFAFFWKDTNRNGFRREKNEFLSQEFNGKMRIGNKTRNRSTRNLPRHRGEKLNASLKWNGQKMIINFLVWLTIVTNGTLIYGCFHFFNSKFNALLWVEEQNQTYTSEWCNVHICFRDWLVFVLFCRLLFFNSHSPYPIVRSNQMLALIKTWTASVSIWAAALAGCNFSCCSLFFVTICKRLNVFNMMHQKHEPIQCLSPFPKLNVTL